jgi:hypothetical protein
MQPADWPGVETEIDRIITDSNNGFTADTIAQVNDVVELLRNRLPVPDVAKGYWSTISLCWQGESLEIEVFGDRVEVYRFYVGRTDIKTFAHKAGEAFPAELLRELRIGVCT